MTDLSTRDVGVHIQEASDDVRRLVLAIEQDNPSCEVSYLPGVVKIIADIGAFRAAEEQREAAEFAEAKTLAKRKRKPKSAPKPQVRPGFVDLSRVWGGFLNFTR